MENDNLLITGGSGFVGRHLINELIKQGYKNIVVVDKVKPKQENVTYIQGDFADENLIRPLLKKCDALFHLAAMIGVDNCRNNPEMVYLVNYTNTKKLIDWAVEDGVKRIIHTSSSEVYGNSKDIPYKEDGQLEPVSEYGSAKVMIEKYLREVQLSGKSSVGVVRLFNVYGPGQKKDFVVSIFVNAAIKNQPLPIFGDGRQTRTFTYVEDVARGICKLYEYNKTPFEIVNLGSNQEFSITELARMVLKCIPESFSKIEYMKHGNEGIRATSYEIDRRVPSVEKAKLLLGFEAETTLYEGLKNVVNFTKANNKQEYLPSVVTT